jgi:hypothetical protein
VLSNTFLFSSGDMNGATGNAIQAIFTVDGTFSELVVIKSHAEMRRRLASSREI